MAKKIKCIQFEDEENINILEKIPGLNKKYIIDLLYSVLNRGTKNFFSAALHKDFFEGERKINIKISKLKSKDRSLIFIELIDVTNQFMEINQLKNNLAEMNF